MSELLRREDLGHLDGLSGVREVTLAHQERRNALSPELLEDLLTELSDAAQAGTRVLILRAERGATTWSAGLEIDSLPVDGSDPLAWSNPLEDVVHALRRAPFPVIAAIEGGVWGGACELVLCCDLLVAMRSAEFAITPVRLGVPYNTAGVNRLLGALPLNVAREMFFTADPVSAEDWARYGVVNRLVDDADELEQQSRRLASRIAQRAPLAVQVIKGEVTALTDARALTSDEAERLADLRHRAWTSTDYREGVRAFVEKRPPRFSGG